PPCEGGLSAWGEDAPRLLPAGRRAAVVGQRRPPQVAEDAVELAVCHIRGSLRRSPIPACHLIVPRRRPFHTPFSDARPFGSFEKMIGAPARPREHRGKRPSRRSQRAWRLVR